MLLDNRNNPSKGILSLQLLQRCQCLVHLQSNLGGLTLLPKLPFLSLQMLNIPIC